MLAESCQWINIESYWSYLRKGLNAALLQRLGQNGSYVQGITPDSEWDEGALPDTKTEI